MDRKAHWQQFYATRASDTLSWFQATPRISLTLLEHAGLSQDT